MSAGSLFHTVNPCWQHPRIVEDQTILGGKIVQNIVKVPVFYFACAFVQHHQAGVVPGFDGSLSNELLWQIKMKIACFHGRSLPS